MLITTHEDKDFVLSTPHCLRILIFHMWIHPNPPDGFRTVHISGFLARDSRGFLARSLNRNDDCACAFRLSTARHFARNETVCSGVSVLSIFGFQIGSGRASFPQLPHFLLGTGFEDGRNVRGIRIRFFQIDSHQWKVSSSRGKRRLSASQVNVLRESLDVDSEEGE